MPRAHFTRIPICQYSHFIVRIFILFSTQDYFAPILWAKIVSSVRESRKHPEEIYL